MHITVCVCTFKRPALLAKLLESLAAQTTNEIFTYSVVVTDNDREQSAKSVAAEYAAGAKLEIKYCCEPEQNIALARNLAVRNARGDFIAFIDDDEFAPPTWLLTLVDTCNSRSADGVLAPVRPHFDSPPPEWLVKGQFCERPEYETGYVLKWRETRTGNALVRRNLVENVDEPFRRGLGNGGEDQDFFRRMMEKNHTFVWCNEAPVYEVVPPDRWTRTYLVRRALLRGQNERHMTDLRGILKSLIAVPVYTAMLPILAIAGHHLFMRYVVKLMDHAGRLMGLLGIRPAGGKYLSG